MSVDSEMTALADAIRAKSGVEGRLSIAKMTEAVTAIQTGGGSNVILGIVDADRNFQPVVFDGKDPIIDGECEVVDEYYSWNNNSITVSAIPVISISQFSKFEFDLSPYISVFTGIFSISCPELPDGLYIDGSKICGVMTRTGEVVVNATVRSKGAADKSIKLSFNIDTISAVFSAPLSSRSTAAETGQAITESGGISYTTSQGVPCVYLDGSSWLESSDNGFPEGASPRTISFWINTESLGSGTRYIVSYGTFQEKKYCGTCVSASGESQVRFIFSNYNASTNDLSDLVNTWHHLVFTYDGVSTATIYIDGAVAASSLNPYNVVPETQLSGTLYIGRRHDGTGNNFVGHVAGLRIFDRALSVEEIKALGKEFNPAPEGI